MTNKHTRSKYKGVKWCNTRYAKPYKFRMALKRIQVAGVLAQAIHMVQAIKSAPSGGDPDVKTAKIKAMLDTVSMATKAVNNICQSKT
jgi:hypothetical protein